MYNVRQVLGSKGNEVWFVTPETTTINALWLLKDKDIGALVVLNEGQLVGIVSERDFVREIAEKGATELSTPVKEFMTRTVHTIDPEQTLEDCMRLMTAHRIRHLPVVEHDRLIGIISIGDVVKECMGNREETIHTLEDYILNQGYGH